jgi:hypothetical protein
MERPIREDKKMHQLDSMLTALNEHAVEASLSLGGQWDEFRSKVEDLAKDFAAMEKEPDQEKLADIRESVTTDLQNICLDYPMLGQLIRLLPEISELKQEDKTRIPQIPNKPDKIKIRETINRYQSLVSTLKKQSKPNKVQR